MIDLNALDPMTRLLVQRLQREHAALTEKHAALVTKHATMASELGREAARAQVLSHYIGKGVAPEQAANLSLLAVHRAVDGFDEDGRPTRGGSVVDVGEIARAFEASNAESVKTASTPRPSRGGSAGEPNPFAGGGAIPAEELHSGNVSRLLQAGVAAGGFGPATKAGQSGNADPLLGTRLG